MASLPKRSVAPYMAGLPRRHLAAATATNNRGRTLVTEGPFTVNTTWTAPPGVSVLESVTGRGGSGSPSSTASANNVLVDTVQGSATGTGAHAGSLSGWSGFNDAAMIVTNINNGTQGATFSFINYTEYPNSSTYDDSINTGVILAPYIQGSASASYSAGWKFSGSVLASDYGQSFISYQYTVDATTGASTTGFGLTFTGGVGGAATPSTATKVTVTPGAGNVLVIPAGGSITITYYK
jgi:hypothetical protein